MRSPLKSTRLTHVQGETLDALKEGVAVFGADGRMKLFNPVFAEMWRFDAAKLRDRPHIDEIAGACRCLCQDPDTLGGACARWSSAFPSAAKAGPRGLREPMG